MKPFFADSYAILAALRGDPAYMRRFAAEFRTSFLNLMECYFYLLKKGLTRDAAMAAMREYEPHALAADWPTLRDAATFRIEMRAKGRDCSFVDAIGFVLARREALPFLTGDRAFKKLPGVEFLPAST